MDIIIDEGSTDVSFEDTFFFICMENFLIEACFHHRIKK